MPTLFERPAKEANRKFICNYKRIIVHCRNPFGCHNFENQKRNQKVINSGNSETGNQSIPKSLNKCSAPYIAEGVTLSETISSY